jgi:hypothetical protein
MKFLGVTSSTVVAKATAGILFKAKSCVYILNSNANNALTVSGSATLAVSGCSVQVNSSSSSALNLSGNASVTASQILIHGGTNISGGATASPAPTTGAAVVTDPFASLPAPTYSGCDYTNESISSTTTTLNHGVYCGGLNISGGSSVTLNSGIYILNGGGLNISASTVNGSNVMFYNTGSSGHSAGSINISGSSNVTLSAPNSGTYMGITFFQDRAVTQGGTISSGTGNISGTYYFPNAAFTFSGSASGAATSAFVVDTLNISGNASLNNDPTGTVTGLGGSPVGLVQ